MAMTLTVLLAALAAQSPAAHSVQPQAAIAFADSGGIADWHVRDERSLYVMDRPGQWYLATLEGQCWNLPFENTLSFDTGPTGRFDSFSAIITQYGRCQLQSLVRSERPAVKGLKGRAR